MPETARDLNRDFLDVWPAEFDPIRVALEAQSFDIGLDLHGGPKRTDFFMIKGVRDGDFSQKVLKAMGSEPLLKSYTDTYAGFAGTKVNPKVYRMLNPGETISDNVGTLKTWMQNRPLWWAGTLEYPGKMDPIQAHAGLYRMALSVLWNARNEAPELYRGLGK